MKADDGRQRTEDRGFLDAALLTLAFFLILVLCSLTDRGPVVKNEPIFHTVDMTGWVFQRVGPFDWHRVK